MTGVVWQAVQVTPRSANFGRMTADQVGDQPLVRTVTVENNVSDTLNLTNLRSNNPAFRLESKVLEPGKKAEVTVTLLTPLKSGNNYARIQADTGVAKMPELTFAASAYIMAEVEVTPPAITLQPNMNQKTTRFVTIRNGGKTPLKVSDVKVSNPAITAQLTETTPGKNFRIVLQIPAGTEIAATGEKLTMNTDNPKFSELSVPIQERGAPMSRTTASTALRPIARPSFPQGTAGPGDPSKLKAVAPTAKPTTGQPVNVPQPENKKQDKQD